MDLVNIHKAGGILIKDRKFMLEKHGDNDTYIIPGGKLEINESAEDALIREFYEEFHLQISKNKLDKLGSFLSQAIHSPDKIVTIDTFVIKQWTGEIILGDGIQEVIWVNSQNIKDFKVSPITLEILPKLLEKNLID